MDKLGIRELLRYGYSGFLCVLVAGLMDGEGVQKLVTQLGAVLSPLSVLALGTTVYLIFKTLIGELMLWRLINWAHARSEVLLKRPGTRCKVRFLEDSMGVRRGQGLAAFALVRDELLSEHARDRFHIQHSEGYLLFLTAFICGIAAIVGSIGGLAVRPSSRLIVVLALMSLIALVAAVWHDVLVCRAERAALGALPEGRVKETLRAGGF